MIMLFDGSRKVKHPRPRTTHNDGMPVRIAYLLGQFATQLDRRRAVLQRALHKAQQLADRVVDLAQVVGAGGDEVVMRRDERASVTGGAE